MTGREASGTQEWTHRGSVGSLISEEGGQEPMLLGADRDCVEACRASREACTEASTHCLRQTLRGRTEYVETLRVTTDCCDFLSVTGILITRRSTLAGVAGEACAYACETCAVACEQLGHDELLRDCARRCRACARVCRDFVHGSGARE